MPIETWYVMDDNSVADPSAVAPDAKGVLRHKDGRAVAYRPDGLGPRTRSVDPAEEAAKAKPKDMKPEDKRGGYKTRETKAG